MNREKNTFKVLQMSWEYFPTLKRKGPVTSESPLEGFHCIKNEIRPKMKAEVTAQESQSTIHQSMISVKQEPSTEYFETDESAVNLSQNDEVKVNAADRLPTHQTEAADKPGLSADFSTAGVKPTVTNIQQETATGSDPNFPLSDLRPVAVAVAALARNPGLLQNSYIKVHQTPRSTCLAEGQGTSTFPSGNPEASAKSFVSKVTADGQRPLHINARVYLSPGSTIASSSKADQSSLYTGTRRQLPHRQDEKVDIKGLVTKSEQCSASSDLKESPGDKVRKQGKKLNQESQKKVNTCSERGHVGSTKSTSRKELAVCLKDMRRESDDENDRESYANTVEHLMPMDTAEDVVEASPESPSSSSSSRRMLRNRKKGLSYREFSSNEENNDDDRDSDWTEKDDDGGDDDDEEEEDDGDGDGDEDDDDETEGDETMHSEQRVTRCICGFQHDDGLLVCCGKCRVMQHGICMQVDPDHIPDDYLCEVCEPRRVRKEFAKRIQAEKSKFLSDYHGNGNGQQRRATRGKEIAASRKGSDFFSKKAEKTAECISCETCGKNFVTFQGLKKHINRIHKNKTARKVCSKKISITSQLFGHHDTVNKSKSRAEFHSTELRCKSCGKVFDSSKSLKLHKMIHSGERRYKCTTCGKSFVQDSSLRCHLRTHTGEKPFPCDVCGKRFSQYGSRNIHKRRFHMTKCTCPTCGKKVTGKIAFRKHLQTHKVGRGMRKKKHECHVCKHSCGSPSGLKEHLRSHTGETPFKCSTCGIGFTRKSNLNRHLKHNSDHSMEKGKGERREGIWTTPSGISNGADGGKMFLCPVHYCSCRFILKNDLDTHMKYIHGPEKLTTRGKAKKILTRKNAT